MVTSTNNYTNRQKFLALGRGSGRQGDPYPSKEENTNLAKVIDKDNPVQEGVRALSPAQNLLAKIQERATASYMLQVPDDQMTSDHLVEANKHGNSMAYYALQAALQKEPKLEKQHGTLAAELKQYHDSDEQDIFDINGVSD